MLCVRIQRYRLIWSLPILAWLHMELLILALPFVWHILPYIYLCIWILYGILILTFFYMLMFFSCYIKYIFSFTSILILLYILYMFKCWMTYSIFKGGWFICLVLWLVLLVFFFQLLIGSSLLCVFYTSIWI